MRSHEALRLLLSFVKLRLPNESGIAVIVAISITEVGEYVLRDYL